MTPPAAKSPCWKSAAPALRSCLPAQSSTWMTRSHNSIRPMFAPKSRGRECAQQRVISPHFAAFQRCGCDTAFQFHRLSSWRCCCDRQGVPPQNSVVRGVLQLAVAVAGLRLPTALPPTASELEGRADRVSHFEPGRYTASRSNSNSNMLTHPARAGGAACRSSRSSSLPAPGSSER